MIIKNFCNMSGNKVSFSRQQASDFAKKIADDFNPLHDITAKRFCVPGDLLFAVALSKAGLHQKMSFTFSAMVSNDIALNFPEVINKTFSIKDDNEKEYLDISVAGEQTDNKVLIDSLIDAYVGFSGHTFPHVLGQLMASNNVMINPARPMVMYESMSLELEYLDINDISLTLSQTNLTLNGKRGSACLEFDLLAKGKVIGQGKKHMLLSGLKAYCPEAMAELSNRYNSFKADYLA
ncbi:MAG: hypothetical protein ACI9C0_001136 [Alteromonadaceae bacterium]|jgi:hypothetical protein|tara:strand:- start:785 stop:1492 length:708 start_codon:yes stop_codon:yes gene_type:complete